MSKNSPPVPRFRSLCHDRGRPIVLALVTSAVLMSGCVMDGLAWPLVADTDWARYESARFGFALQYPAMCEVEEHPGGVIFRHLGDPILVVNVSDEEEGRRRGLWFDHEPVGELVVAGRSAQRYDYIHFDGPAGVRTVSFVVPHDGRFLGVEMRIIGEPGPTQERVLSSLRLGLPGEQWASRQRADSGDAPEATRAADAPGPSL